MHRGLGLARNKSRETTHAAQAPAVRSRFRIVLGDEHSQAAQMTLGPGQSEGGPDNQHRGADQWLYVVAGTGLAIINNTPIELREGTLLLIQRGDKHEIRNTGDGPF